MYQPDFHNYVYSLLFFLFQSFLKVRLITPLADFIYYGTASFKSTTCFQVLTSREEKKEGKSASQGDDQDPDKVSFTCFGALGLMGGCCCYLFRLG